MEQLLEQLKELGYTDKDCEAVRKAYTDESDLAALREYVLLIRLHYDDRHEFLD